MRKPARRLKKIPMRKYLILLLFSSAVCFGQSISNYKYVIIPAKFSAQKKPGQFGLNELTRQFMQKNGYTAYLDSEILPAEVIRDNCNKIYVNVLEDNTLRKTRLWVEIKDCTNKVLFTSARGESLEKDNRVAYNQALRAAFKSFDKPEFKYDPSAKQHENTPGPALSKITEAVAPQKAGVEPGTRSQASVGPPGDVLNAQPIENGYQLVDTTPKIVLKMFTTSNPDVFIGEADNAKGVVTKKSGKWFFEYYEQKTLVVKPLNIKF